MHPIGKTRKKAKLQVVCKKMSKKDAATIFMWYQDEEFFQVDSTIFEYSSVKIVVKVDNSFNVICICSKNEIIIKEA